MHTIFIPVAVTVLTFFTVRTQTLSIEDLANLENGKYERDVNDEPENPTDIRKLLLKKLRFREVLQDTPFTSQGFAPLEFEDDAKESHKAKRRNMDDILTRVRALLSDMKERQAKETMSLPSLRFGRSGLSYQKAH